jgi:hypothetical protein
VALALIGRERFVAIGGDLERVPSDQHGSRLLGAVEAHEIIGEAEKRAGRLLAFAQDRFWQCVIGAVCEVIAIDDEQWTAFCALALFLFDRDGGLCRWRDSPG